MLTSGHQVLNVDKLTYAGNLQSLQDVERHAGYQFVQLDITDGPAVQQIIASYQPDAIMHLAAESHVDRSIDGPGQFIETNVLGTFNLLQSVLKYWRDLTGDRRDRFRFLHVSTDEVYGSLGTEGYFTESTRYDPHSPYSASKASSDHLVRAWGDTYGLPILVTNCSNNYGPYQFPEKLIPVVILKCLRGEPIPVYGKGENIRDWLYVEDHCRALELVLHRGRPGQTYNIGGNNELKNIDLVHTLCDLMDELLEINSPRPVKVTGCTTGTMDELLETDSRRPVKVTGCKTGTMDELLEINSRLPVKVTGCTTGTMDELLQLNSPRPFLGRGVGGEGFRSLITFVTDRPGHDLRYAIDASKIQNELRWSPQQDHQSAFRKTVQWYLDNQPWWEAILSGDYRLERLGVSGAVGE